MDLSANHCSRPVQVGPIRFSVTSDDAAVIARFDRLFSGFDDAGTAAPFDARAAGEAMELTVTGHYDSTVDGVPLLSSGDLGAHELAITRVLNQRKLDAEPHLLHLHSAAVARDGRAVVMAAMSGSGKSTLAAALAQEGWGYVTDEQVALRPGDGALLAYPRPITIRRSVWPLFAAVDEVPSPRRDDLENARAEVSPAAFGSVHLGPSWPVAVVVPLHDAGGEKMLTRFESTAEVVEYLASCCYDLERLGVSGMEVLVDMAGKCPAWRLHYDELDDAVARVDELFQAAVKSEPLPVRHIRPTTDRSPLSGGMVRRVHSAHAWAFGDGSTVVYDPPTGKITRLDAAGTTVWELLHDAHGLADLVELFQGETDEAEYGIRNWLHTMVTAGLVEEADHV